MKEELESLGLVQTGSSVFSKKTSGADIDFFGVYSVELGETLCDLGFEEVDTCYPSLRFVLGPYDVFLFVDSERYKTYYVAHTIAKRSCLRDRFNTKEEFTMVFDALCGGHGVRNLFEGVEE